MRSRAKSSRAFRRIIFTASTRLNITNGNEQPYSPVVVAASVPGTRRGRQRHEGDVLGHPAFATSRRSRSPAAILYVCYGSHADTDPYHGWVIGYQCDATSCMLTNYIFNTTPNATTGAFGSNAGEGALWMGGNGLCVDANTNLYFETANGSFSANTNGGDYGDSFVKLSTTNESGRGGLFHAIQPGQPATADDRTWVPAGRSCCRIPPAARRIRT